MNSFFLKHKNVIPTLRKIYNIDFFLRVDNQIIPFDLKITHISDDYFEIVSKGISKFNNSNDDFTVIQQNESELETIKSYYKDYKKNHRNTPLKNISEFKNDTKAALSDYIAKLDSPSKQFISKLQNKHSTYVPSNNKELKTLEWWNYKFQGERLFCNNNRLFIFLAYKNKFYDGKDLKGNTIELTKIINTLLDNLSKESIHKINYHYEKDPKLNGNYTALSLSAIYLK